MDKDIIRIAEECFGWIHTKGSHTYPMSSRQDEPYETWHIRGEDKLWDYLPFNPLKSHADCHALIEWLNGRGYEVDVLHWEEGDATVMLKRSAEVHGKRFYAETTVADYREGLVNLTLKILESDDV